MNIFSLHILLFLVVHLHLPSLSVDYISALYILLDFFLSLLFFVSLGWFIERAGEGDEGHTGGGGGGGGGALLSSILSIHSRYLLHIKSTIPWRG